MTDSDGSMEDGMCQGPLDQHTSGSDSGACQNTSGQDERSGATPFADKDASQSQASGANSRPALHGFVKKGGRPVTWVGGGGMDAKRLANLGVPQLRTLFLEVFGEHTASNNASWLRRKLSECPDKTYGQGRCPTVRARDSCAAIWTSGTTQGEDEAGPGACAPQPQTTQDGSLASAQTTRPNHTRASSRNSDHVVPSNDWQPHQPAPSHTAHAPSDKASPMQSFDGGGRGARRSSLKRSVSCSGYTESVPVARSVAAARVKEEQGTRCQRTIITWEGFGDQYLNHSVEVYWPADKTWWGATITQLDLAAQSMHLVYSNMQEEDVNGPDLQDMLQSGQLSEGWHPRNCPARRPSSRRLLTLRLPSELAYNGEASPSTICSNASTASRASRLTSHTANFSGRSNRASSFSVGAAAAKGAEEQLVLVKEDPDADHDAKKTCIRASELLPGMLTHALAAGREGVPLLTGQIANQAPLLLHGTARPLPPRVYRTHSLPRCSSTGDGSAAWLEQQQQQQQQWQEEHHVLDGLVLPDLAPLAASFAKDAAQHEWLQAAQDTELCADADCSMAAEEEDGLQLQRGCRPSLDAAAPLPLLGARLVPLLGRQGLEHSDTAVEGLLRSIALPHSSAGAAGAGAAEAFMAMDVDIDVPDWLSHHDLGHSSDDGTSGASLSDIQDIQALDGLDDGNGCYEEIDNLLSRPLADLAVVSGSALPAGAGGCAMGGGSGGGSGNGGSCRSFADLSLSHAGGGNDRLGGHLVGLFDF